MVSGGTAAFLVDLPIGGSLEMQENVLARGPQSPRPIVAVRVMEGSGARAVSTLVLSDNTLRNNTHNPLIFLLNWTASTARMENNHLSQNVTLVSSSGYLLFLTKTFIHRGLAAAKTVARAFRRYL